MILTLFIILITGERSNLIKAILFFIFFITIIRQINFKKKILIFSGVVFVFFLTFNFISTTKVLYTQLIDSIFFDHEVTRSKGKLTDSLYDNFLYWTHSGHYVAAYEIANDYPAFGVGVKNFRTKCIDKKYINKNVPKTLARCATHPHQVFLEIVSETGYSGLVFIILPFVIFFYNNLLIYLKHNNIFHLALLCYLVTQFTPILPSGSFFTNFNGITLWLNIGFLLSASRFKNN